MTRIAVTGLGAVTCLGDDLGATWAALISGRTGIATVPALARAGLAVTMGGALAGASEDPAARELTSATRAIDEACGAARVAAADASLAWASGLDAISLDGGYRRTPSSVVFARIGARFASRRWRFATACAAGADAIAGAVRAIRADRGGVWVAGGSSAMLTPFYVHGLAQLAVLAPDRAGGDVCRPFDRSRAGTTLADGAAAMVLEPLEGARRRGARVIAELVGVGTSQDAHDLLKPPADGAGAALALRRALADGGLAPTSIDAVVAHATGTRGGDAAEARALASVLGEHTADVAVTAPKGALGHMMMAAGAIGAAVAVQGIVAGLLPPTAGLADPDPSCALDHVRGDARPIAARAIAAASFGMGGHDVVLIFAKGDDR